MPLGGIYAQGKRESPNRPAMFCAASREACCANSHEHNTYCLYGVRQLAEMSNFIVSIVGQELRGAARPRSDQTSSNQSARGCKFLVPTLR